MRIALVAPSSTPLAPLAPLAPPGRAAATARRARPARADRHEGPGSGAEAARIASLAHSLAGLGHRVTIYARKDSPAIADTAIVAPGIAVEHVTAGPAAPLDDGELTAFLPEFGDYLARRWRRNPPDVVHAYCWTAGLAARAGARDLGVPVALTFGSLGVAERRHGTGDPSQTRIRLEVCLARSADVVLASSAGELADLASLGVPRARVKVVPCGVDTHRFSPDGPAAQRSGRPRLLAAEQLPAGRPGPGLDAAIRALAEVPGAELVVTGGPDRAGLRKDAACRHLLRLAGRHGVADRLVVTGRISGDDLPALLRSADLMVSTASYEPVGMAAIQAMACGTPVITSSSGAERDAVVDLTTGLVLPPGQPALLAARIRRLLANSLKLEAYGIAAADRARSRYVWERIGRETLAAYGARSRAAAAAAAGARSTRPRRAAAAPRRTPAGTPA